MLYNLLLKGNGMQEEERQRVRRELLRYCRTDTETNVKLHVALAGLISR